MSARETATARRMRLAAGVYMAIRKQRTTMQARARQHLEQHMLDGQQQALDAAIVVSAPAAKDKAPRRTVKRAAGSWRGSTIAGYLQGDNATPAELQVPLHYPLAADHTDPYYYKRGKGVVRVVKLKVGNGISFKWLSVILGS